MFCRRVKKLGIIGVVKPCELMGRFLLISLQNLSVCGLDYDPKASKAHGNTEFFQLSLD